ncbi:MAG: hypothetical protein H5U09_07035 [Desulfomicrobiaceae bacterium]|nr:hypothetical protein [Desulfomicrobiaceae bacterium]
MLWWLVAMMIAGMALSAAAGRGRLGAVLGPAVMFAVCLAGLGFALGPDGRWVLPFAPPLGSGALRLDAVARFFLLPLFGLGAMVAIYGVGYLQHAVGRRHLGVHWAVVLLLLLGMTVVFLADDGFVFLVGWELMSVAPFFLVAFDDHDASVRAAAWEYLAAAHLGGAALVAGLALAAASGGWSFDAMRAALPGSALALPVFGLMVLGGGAKAGLVPLHVWLPEAHPAAPSHVSALMSGLMVNTGIYAVVRALDVVGMPGAGAGVLLVLAGLVSAVFGAMQALVQGNAKRLLAFSTVENMGLVFMAVGVGIVGYACGLVVTAWLGLAAALMHLLHHSLFKGLLFMGAGAVLEATGTVELRALGGIAQRMPQVSRCMAVGVATVSGLPPFCGLVGEVLLFAALATGMAASDPGLRGVMLAGFVGLALVSGVVLAGMTRLFGIAFLGAPRSPQAAEAKEPGMLMRLPMMVLAAACLAAAVAAPVVLGLALPAVGVVLGAVPREPLAPFVAGVAQIATIGVVVAVAVVVVAGVRRLLPGWADARRFRTWDCGYAAPSVRMQYSAFGFAQPLWRAIGGTSVARVTVEKPVGFFPAHAWARVEPADPLRTAWERLFGGVRSMCDALKWLQHGRIQLYVFTMVAVLGILIVWRLWGE